MSHFRKCSFFMSARSLFTFTNKLKSVNLTMVNHHLKNKMSKDDWVKRNLELIEMERKAEKSAAEEMIGQISCNLKLLEAQGLVLRNLSINERSTGLYGRPLLSLCINRKENLLPTNRFTSGDIIGIYENVSDSTSPLATGVIHRITATSVKIALDEDSDEMESLSFDALLRIHKLSSDVTFNRIKSALEELQSMASGPASHVISVLFHETSPRKKSEALPPRLTDSAGNLIFFNRRLDQSQRDAVQFSLNRSDLVVIHGPPGTGKTTTIVEAIRQHLKLGMKVLACAPSNLAVDNLAEKLSESKERIVRIGHPSRATALAQCHTLDALIFNSNESELLSDVHTDINKQLLLLKKSRNKGDKIRIRNEIKTLRKEAREREMRMTKDILGSSGVVLATLSSSGRDGPLKVLPIDHFDLVVIDECSQATEASCYSAILQSPKLILAGDHCQLPPTITSKEAAQEGLDYSLMERVIDQIGADVVQMLIIQYRMNCNIMNWSSNAMYNDQLIAHNSVASHLLCHLPDVEETEETECALILIDTAGCECYELDACDDLSKGNQSEAIIVFNHVKRLVLAGVNPNEIAVVTPYNLQVEIIRNLLRNYFPQIETKSVDGFQGREKEAVVMSLVRSNLQGIVGFLSEDRRLNVAVTRARRHLAVVCDTQTVCQHSFLKTFVEYMTTNGLVRTAHEFENEIRDTQVVLPERSISTKVKGKESKAKVTKKKREQNKKQDGSKEVFQEEISADTRYEEYTNMLKHFNRSPETEVVFPFELNSFERRLVHEIAEELNLIHISQGEGIQRSIKVLKRDDEQKKEEETFNVKIEGNQIVEIATEINETNKEDKFMNKLSPDWLPKVNALTVSNSANDGVSDTISVRPKVPKGDQVSLKPAAGTNHSARCHRCDVCHKEIPVSNYEIHRLHCEKARNNHDPSNVIQPLISNTNCKKKKNLSKISTKSEDDFDEIIAEFQMDNVTCSFQRCNASTKLMYQICNFCKRSFCLQHHLPEIHGCGADAKAHARAVTIREGIIYPGSGVPSKKPNETKRSQMHHQLDKKLEELAKKRMAKKPANKK